ncbi:MAG: hypothetical protein JWO00_672 [Candidatus Parcubacteria bacterium]|nr:hypothetical protein [Candidatus Parcubacteria bacterium]
MPPASLSTKPEKILIIESNGAFGSQIDLALKKDGYENVFLLKNGADGLKAIYDYLPHLIILDVALSDGDGYTVVEKKHAEPLLTRIPLYLMSTDGQPITMSRIPNGSVKEFLISMHITPEEVVGKVNACFGHQTAADMEKQAAANTSAKKKILWVEDDKLIGNILMKKLTSSGFDIFHAKSGDEAIEGLKTFAPDAVVLDLVLPGMSGFDILQKIREDNRFKNVPAMILSNLSKQSDIERAKSLGAQKFLVKASVSLDQIIEEVRGLCR